LVAFGSVPVSLIVGGTVGYHILERWSWFDSLYVTVITLTSIGYGDKHAYSPAGRVFTMVLALGGIFTVAVAATEILSTIITGELRDYWENRRMNKRIEALEQHVIVCGYGNVGRQVCANLASSGVPLVVIDRLDTAFAAARDEGVHALWGDAAADAILRRAGIERARALLALAGTDADNVLITMTAHQLSPPLSIVARALEDATVPKLQLAGAARTVSPPAIVAGRVTHAVLHPTALEFIEVVTKAAHTDLELEERAIDPGSALDGATVGTTGLRSGSGSILVAIKHADGRLAFNPGYDAKVVAGDTLITLSAVNGRPPPTQHRSGLGLFGRFRSRRRFDGRGGINA
jgi:voltage-gated potassium channel